MTVLRFSLGCLCLAWPVCADWRDDAGLPALQAELGAAMPTGQGIVVLQSEASETPAPAITYLAQGATGTAPYAGTGIFAGKTFTPISGSSSTSGHAFAVAARLFGTGYTASPGVATVQSWLADDYAGALLFTDPVPSFTGDVQNHSWAGTTDNAAWDLDLNRRLDFMIDRDGPIVAVPMNNGAGMQPLLANTYHALTVGLVSGNHPHSGTTIDGTGRMKPDLVVDEAYTSFASPCVASTAAILMEAIRSSQPAAEDPRVVKAILIAAASKQPFPAWQRASVTKPYDAITGAGRLNALHAYHILAAGKQAASATVERGLRGWDLGVSNAASPLRYFFRVPRGRWANTLSIAITWHRAVDVSAGTSVLPDLNLSVSSAEGFIPGAVLDQSASTVDNVEHVFLRHLPAGLYVLEVAANTSDVPCAVAWEADLGDGPQLNVQHQGSSNTLALSILDPLRTYVVEASVDLIHWDIVTSLRTADTSPSFDATLTDSNASPMRFYRLAWTL